MTINLSALAVWLMFAYIAHHWAWITFNLCDHWFIGSQICYTLQNIFCFSFYIFVLEYLFQNRILPNTSVTWYLLYWFSHKDVNMHIPWLDIDVYLKVLTSNEEVFNFLLKWFPSNGFTMTGQEGNRKEIKHEITKPSTFNNDKFVQHFLLWGKIIGFLKNSDLPKFICNCTKTVSNQN